MERPERRKLDDEGLPLPPRAEGRAAHWLLMIMERGETVLFIAIALALLVIAVVVFVHGVHDLLLAPAHEEFAVTVTRAVNSVLFIVVVLELLRTIVARLEGGGFQLQPFLVIGIISATRDILTVVAELSSEIAHILIPDVVHHPYHAVFADVRIGGLEFDLLQVATALGHGFSLGRTGGG